MLPKGKLGLIVIVLLMLLVGLLNIHPKATEDTRVLSEGYEVLRVIDGDTIEVSIDGEPVTVRMIGIDCPESVHPDESLNTEYGDTAAEFTKSLLEGKNVILEYDEQLTDDYGRTLAYIYIEGRQENSIAGNHTVQCDLLAEGYARALKVEPNVKYAETFRVVESRAKHDEVGFWGNYFKENSDAGQ